MKKYHSVRDLESIMEQCQHMVCNHWGNVMAFLKYMSVGKMVVCLYVE